MDAWFRCDHRSLAAFRVLLAGAVLVDLATTAGAGPTVVVVLSAVAAVFLGCGYRTRLAAGACWLLLAAHHAHDRLTLVLADSWLMALLVFAVVVPLSTRFSLDAAVDSRNAPDAEQTTAPEPEPPVILTAVFKIQLVLTLAATVAGVARAPGLIVAAAAFVALLPARVWHWLAVLPGMANRYSLRLYFDEDCGFCRKLCYAFREFLILGDARIAPAQDDPAVFAIMEEKDSWVVFDHDGQHYERWHAVLLVLRRSPLLWPLGALLRAIGMGRWGDPIYAVIAALRGHFSKITAVLLPYRREKTLTGAWLAGAALAWLALAVAVRVFDCCAQAEDAGFFDAVAHALGFA